MRGSWLTAGEGWELTGDQLDSRLESAVVGCDLVMLLFPGSSWASDVLRCSELDNS